MPEKWFSTPRERNITLLCLLAVVTLLILVIFGFDKFKIDIANLFTVEGENTPKGISSFDKIEGEQFSINIPQGSPQPLQMIVSHLNGQSEGTNIILNEKIKSAEIKTKDISINLSGKTLEEMLDAILASAEDTIPLTWNREGVNIFINPNVPTSELDPSLNEAVEIYSLSAKTIMKKFDSDINYIETQALKFNKNIDPFKFEPHDQIPSNTVDVKCKDDKKIMGECKNKLWARIQEESLQKTQNLRDLKIEFIDLHEQHIQALKKNQRVLEREIENKIRGLFKRYEKILIRNIGSTSPESLQEGVVYLHGYEKVWINTRDLYQFEKPLNELYGK